MAAEDLGEDIRNSKRSRGGRHQKAAASAAGTDDREVSMLARMLLEDYCYGFISAPSVQRIAAAAKHDGLSHHHVDVLAGLGTAGKHEGNIANDLD